MFGLDDGAGEAMTESLMHSLLGQPPGLPRNTLPPPPAGPSTTSGDSVGWPHSPSPVANLDGSCTPLLGLSMQDTPGSIPMLPLLSPGAMPSLGIGPGALASCGMGRSLEHVVSVATDPLSLHFVNLNMVTVDVNEESMDALMEGRVPGHTPPPPMRVPTPAYRLTPHHFQESAAPVDSLGLAQQQHELCQPLSLPEGWEDAHLEAGCGGSPLPAGAHVGGSGAPQRNLFIKLPARSGANGVQEEAWGVQVVAPASGGAKVRRRASQDGSRRSLQSEQTLQEQAGRLGSPSSSHPHAAALVPIPSVRPAAPAAAAAAGSSGGSAGMDEGEEDVPVNLTVPFLDENGYFDMTLQQAAVQLGVGVTTLKKLCRMNGLGRWPYRARCSLRKLRDKMREYFACAPAEEREAADALMGREFSRLARMNVGAIDEAVKQFRQAMFKLEFKARQQLDAARGNGGGRKRPASAGAAAANGEGGEGLNAIMHTDETIRQQAMLHLRRLLNSVGDMDDGA